MTLRPWAKRVTQDPSTQTKEGRDGRVEGGYWEISEVKKCNMFPMPLTLANTLRLPGAPSTNSSVKSWGFSLLTGRAEAGGDFHWNLHHFPFRMIAHAPHVCTPSQLCCPCCLGPGLEGSGPLPPSSIIRKGVMVERWLACLISFCVGSEGDRKGPSQAWLYQELWGSLQIQLGGGLSGELKYPFL